MYHPIEKTVCRHCGIKWQESGWEYCPECKLNFCGAIYPAVTTPKEMEDAEAVCTKIKGTFGGVDLASGMTIHEASLEGAYFDPRDVERARAKDPERRWIDIPDEKLSTLSSALSFFDKFGWRFHIPAFMTWSLRNWHSTNSITADSTIWSLDPDGANFKIQKYAILSKEQSLSVLEFLYHMVKFNPDGDAQLAIEHYWGQFQEQE